MRFIYRTSLYVVFALLSACNIDVSVTPGGRVVSDPAAIDCRYNSGTCFVKDYERLDLDVEDLIATFRARPDPGYHLVRWEGDCDRRLSNKCYVGLGDDITLRAVFARNEYENSAGQVDKSVSFIAIGDTGRGDLAQFLVGDGIADVCMTRECDFVMGLGDNFYDGTPESPYSTEFEIKFEQAYSRVNLPFYMVLGNHDTGRFRDGDGGNQALGENQVAYHYRTDRTSEKWKMPARYYEFTLPGTETLVAFFALDSAPFVGLPDTNPKYEPYAYGRAQGQWLQQKLAASNADWKIAFAHHPYISNGRHGNAGNYDRSIPGELILDKASGEIFREFMEEYVCDDVDIYFSGHDHNLQLLRRVAPCGKTEFSVSGVGSSVRSLENKNDNQVYFQDESAIGFFHITITGNSMIVTAFAVDSINGAVSEIKRSVLQRQNG